MVAARLHEHLRTSALFAASVGWALCFAKLPSCSACFIVVHVSASIGAFRSGTACHTAAPSSA